MTRPAWVYRVYDGDGRLIYVGATIDLFSRLASHRDSAWWGSQAVKVRAKVYPSVEAARSAEATAIRTEHPRWNIKGRWRTRFAWTADDYRDYATALVRHSRSEYYDRRHFASVEREARQRHGITDLLGEVAA